MEQAPGAGVVCVVLAAGASRRFGRNKLLVPMKDGTLLERALKACSDFPTIAVCSRETKSASRNFRVRTILNEHPERGMSHSLRLANDAIDPLDAIAILPADLLMIEAYHVAQLIALHEAADVTFPRYADGTPGHPVIFSPRARERIARLPDGDTIRLVRDDPQLRRNVVITHEPWPFRDADHESDLANL